MTQKFKYEKPTDPCYNKSMDQGEKQNSNNNTKVLKNTDIKIRERLDNETVELVLNEGQYIISLPRANWIQFMYRCVAWTDAKIYEWAVKRLEEKRNPTEKKSKSSTIIDDPGSTLFDVSKQWELK